MAPPELLTRSLQSAITLEKPVRTRNENDGFELARAEHEVERSPARVRRLMQIVASLACLAAVVVLALFFTSEGIAFAQIQERLCTTRSAKFCYRQVVSTQESKKVVSDSDYLTVWLRTTKKRGSNCRMDVGALQASKMVKRLEVNPDDKTGCFAHSSLTDPHDLVEQLRTWISR